MVCVSDMNKFETFSKYLRDPKLNGVIPLTCWAFKLIVFWIVNSPSVEQHQIGLFCKPYENEFCTVIAKEEQPQEIIVVEPRVQTELALENKLIKINGIWAQLATWQLDKKWIINRAFLEFSHKKKNE